MGEIELLKCGCKQRPAHFCLGTFGEDQSISVTPPSGSGLGLLVVMNAFAWFLQAEGSACWRMWRRRCRAWRPEWSSWKRYLRNLRPISALRPQRGLTFTLSLRAEVAAGAGPLHQRLPAVLGRRLLREDHLTVPLLPAAGSHRLPQRADRLSGGASGHMWVATDYWPSMHSECKRILSYIKPENTLKMWSIRNQTSNLDELKCWCYQKPIRNSTFSSFLQVPVQRIRPRMFSPRAAFTEDASCPSFFHDSAFVSRCWRSPLGRLASFVAPSLWHRRVKLSPFCFCFGVFWISAAVSSLSRGRPGHLYLSI